MTSALVLIPGLLCTKGLYQDQIASLRDHHHHVLVADHTRHDSMTAIAQSILDHAPQRFSLAGLSMGGYVCLEIMRQAPQRVERLMLLDTSARADTPEQTQNRKDFITLSGMGKFRGVTPQMMKKLVHPHHLEREDITSLVYDMAKDVGLEAFIRQQTAIIGRIDSRPFLPQIICPTFVVCGEQDQMTPPVLAEEMHALIPQSELYMIPKAGHLTPLEQPARITTLMKEWLALKG